MLSISFCPKVITVSGFSCIKKAATVKMLFSNMLCNWWYSGITDNVINWLMGSNLSQFTGPKLLLRTQYTFKLIILLLSVCLCPKLITFSCFHFIWYLYLTKLIRSDSCMLVVFSRWSNIWKEIILIRKLIKQRNNT